MNIGDADAAVAQARSVLARATTGYARWLEPDAAERHGSLVTAIYLDHPAATALEYRSPVALEVSDPAPVPVRERVRARVRLFGQAAPSSRAARGIHLQPTTVHFETGDDTVALDPVALWHTEPDPLALAEAGLLGHLHSCHPETMGMLARLIPKEFHSEARSLAPLALDRSGIVLRVEHMSGHIDVRLPFGRDVTNPCEAADAIAALVGIADSPPPEVRESRRRNLLTALMGVGPAAARICAPQGADFAGQPGYRPLSTEEGGRRCMHEWSAYGS